MPLEFDCTFDSERSNSGKCIYFTHQACATHSTRRINGYEIMQRKIDGLALHRLVKSVQHADALEALMAPILARGSVQEWVSKFEAAGVSCSPINDLAQVFADPQVVARQMVRTLEHPSAGPVPIIANPIRLSRTPPVHSLPPPTLGQHTAQVLADVLGMTSNEISRLCPANAKESS